MKVGPNCKIEKGGIFIHSVGNILNAIRVQCYEGY